MPRGQLVLGVGLSGPSTDEPSIASAWGWGAHSGQLGIGTTARHVPSPVRVGTVTTWTRPRHFGPFADHIVVFASGAGSSG